LTNLDEAMTVTPYDSLTIPEFAAKHRVSKSTVWSWVSQGLLIATQVGPRTTRILAEHEAAWLAGPKAAAESRAIAKREKAAA
jgi:predicted DNA-binding transcriptional regulator AlpA